MLDLKTQIQLIQADLNEDDSDEGFVEVWSFVVKLVSWEMRIWTMTGAQVHLERARTLSRAWNCVLMANDLGEGLQEHLRGLVANGSISYIYIDG